MKIINNIKTIAKYLLGSALLAFFLDFASRGQLY